MSRSITCLISGKKFTFTNEYFLKRVEEYGDPETFKKYFVTKKVLSLIYRGYNAAEIRNILAIEGGGLVDTESPEIKSIILYHTMRVESTAKRTSNNFATHKSDEDVTIFINNIKDITYD